MNHKLSLGLAMLPLVPAVQAQEQGRQDGERPNIIFIMSDDHAQQAMSIYGHPIGKVAPTLILTVSGRKELCSGIIIAVILFQAPVAPRYLLASIAIRTAS